MSEKCSGLPGRKVLPVWGLQVHRGILGRRAGQEWGPSSLLGLEVKTLSWNLYYIMAKPAQPEGVKLKSDHRNNASVLKSREDTGFKKQLVKR